MWRRCRGRRSKAGVPGAAAFEDGLLEEVLDLAVDAAQFVLRPGFQLAPERRIDPQQKVFAFSHSRRLRVKRAGIKYRMHLGFAA